jgi:FkbM family methyltransferase
LVQPDYVCFDIGANIGVKSLFLSRHCPQGRVIALEAGPTVARCLTANITTNEARNVVLHHAAAAGYDGILSFQEASAWGHQGAGGVEVEALTLGTLAARHEIQRLDFIKIDVEGGEFPVLKSSLELINRFESLVYMEFNTLTLLVEGDVNPREFIQWICENFRFVYALNRELTGELLTPVTSNDECRVFLYRNLVNDGCVTDLVMSNAAYRFVPVPSYLEQQIQTHLSSLSEALAERDRVEAKLSQALSECEAAKIQLSQALGERDALLASTSWRLSAPIRRLKRTISRSIP